jgi:hypothetical protein
VIGAYFTHGPQAGEFPFVSFASLPKRRAKQPRKTEAERAATHGLAAEEVGTLDAEVFLAFLWTIAGRPIEATGSWRRERRLVVVLDNYSVHKCSRVQAEVASLRKANIELSYLPAYSPELSKIEPVWQDVKYRRMPVRSHTKLGDLKRAVDTALAVKAVELRKMAHSLHQTA